jgi:phosphotransferase system  glucose/maltose/N-acetylglucosamine-specific IIC component
MIQFDAREIKAVLAEILGQRLAMWFLRLVALLGFLWVVKTIYDFVWPPISGVAGALSGIGVASQLAPVISLVVTFVVVFLVVYGTRQASVVLAARVNLADMGAKQASQAAQAALDDTKSLNDRMDAVVKLIEYLKATADAIDKRVTVLDEMEKSDRENWRDQIKINQSAMEANLASIDALSRSIADLAGKDQKRIESLESDVASINKTADKHLDVTVTAIERRLATLEHRSDMQHPPRGPIGSGGTPMGPPQ